MGKTNRADYFSKQHPTKHHIEMRPVYFYSSENPDQNYFDTILEHQANWVEAIAAFSFVTTGRQQESEECSKGVLISHSGLPLHVVSKDPHSNVTDVTEPDEPGGQTTDPASRSNNNHEHHRISDMLINYIVQP